MTTPAPEQANQADAQPSAGPITLVGKARSSANSRTHDLREQNVIAGIEDKDEFEKMAAGFHAQFEPQGQSGRALFQELVTAAWRLRRLRSMEAECCLDAKSYATLLNDEPLQQKLDRLACHHTRIERTFHRCLKELKSVHDDNLYAEARLSADRFKRRPIAVATSISERTQSRCRPDRENSLLAA